MIYRALPTGPLVFGVFGGNGFCSVLRRPIKNQRTGTGIDILPAACRVMAKRLRDVCALPESEPLWRAGRGFVVCNLCQL